jgi:endoglucanase
VGNVDLELHVWARPEDMTWPRPSQKLTSQRPGTDVVANAAAALAAVSLAFQEYDYSYSKLTLRNARNLYAFANTHRGLSSEALPQLAKVSCKPVM